MKVNMNSWYKVFGITDTIPGEPKLKLQVAFIRFYYPYEGVKDFLEVWSGLALFQLLGVFFSAVLFLGPDALVWHFATTMYDGWYQMLLFIVWCIVLLVIFIANTYTIIAGQRLYVKLKQSRAS